MKILVIRVKNLASLEGETVIDFTQEPLASAGLFAITGPIGAGKSTLLDAVCLALFGKTPRYNSNADSKVEIRDTTGSTISQGDVRGILRDGTANGYAEVDFIGVDKQLYRATWSVNRAKGRADGNLQSAVVKGKNLSANTDIPGTKTEVLASIEKLVGLSFDQFTRSVLLAQGDFSTFLKAPNDSRASLLEKLTGTDIYTRISMIVQRKHSEQVNGLRELNVRREGIHTLTGEEITTLRGAVEDLKTIIQDQAKVIADIGKEINWHNDLAKLESHHNEARGVLESADVALQMAKPRDIRLQQIDRVQSAKPLVEHKKSIVSLKSEKEKGYTDIQEALKTLKERHIELETSLKSAADKLSDHIKTQEDAQPKLDAARQLDGRLLEKANQVKDAQAEVKVAEQQLTVYQKIIDAQLLNEKKLDDEVNEIIIWKSDHIASEVIAKNQLFITTRLEDGEKLLKQEADILLTITNARGEIQNKKNELESLNKSLLVLQQSMQTASENYASLHQEVSAIQIDQLKQDKSALEKAIEDLVNGAAHWTLQYSALKEVEEIKKGLVDDERNLNESQSQLETTHKLLDIAKVEYETSRKILERAKLAAAENVENLRGQLIDNEPCPVCGSHEHPYVTHVPTQDVVLEELEKGLQETEAIYLKYNESRSTFTTQCDLLGKSIAAREVSFKTKNKELEELQGKWEKQEVFKDYNIIPEADREEWFKKLLQDSRSRNQNLQIQIKDYDTKKAEVEKKKLSLDKQADKINEDQNKLKDLERVLLSMTDKLSDHLNEEKKTISGLRTLKELMSEYFGSDEWFENWKKDTGDFLTEVKKSVREWDDKVKQYDVAAPQLALLKEKIKSGNEQLDILAKNLSGKKEVQENVEIQYNDLSRERKALWDGKPVAEIDELLREEVAKSRKVMEACKVDSDSVGNNISGKSAQMEQIERDILAFQEQIVTADTGILQWLHAYHARHAEALTVEELLQHLVVTQEWLEMERTALRGIENEFVQAETIWKERGDRLSKHAALRLSEKDVHELNTQESELKEFLDNNKKSLNEIGYRLEQDALNKESVGELLKAITEQTKIVDNWAKLNDVIGSADGKKFRQIAQEYTLDVLLKYANVHLETLNNRYELQRVPGSLGLQVMDQDMGNEVRAVNSLSGGETFLVSLGLALGLASLSSNRMSVESLFIDEGFGSLDQHTLGIAVGALERLQNQGRKVGVITHVQEMQERIGVQIKVSKEQSGRSRVEII